MPGRKISGSLPSKNKRPSKRKAKRSQDALVIAERENPERSKIRQNRLGESEPEPVGRKRKSLDDVSDSEGNTDRDAKRRKAGAKDRYGNEIEMGSDSSGNEWMVGQVDDDEDSDIDSDEAMAESDDEGAAIKGSVAHSSNNRRPPKATDPALPVDKSQEVDLWETEDGQSKTEDESDSFGEEAVDLAAMLDESDDSADLPKVSRRSRSVDDNKFEDESDGGTGTEYSEEAAESELSISGDEDEADDPKKLASLQALVSTMDRDNQPHSHFKKRVNAQETIAPSEFGLTTTRKLTVADIAPSITDPKLRQSLRLLADNDTKTSSKKRGIPKKLDVPLPKRQQDRLDRAAAYEKSKETLDRWIDTVKHNRRAEHLSFPLKDPQAVAARSSTRLLPPSQSKPLTDLESTIQNIMIDSGLADPDRKPDEDQLQSFEELKTNKLPLEDVQARRAELRRARELLFREEIRAKRINKIKSKTYRKVHRKERERNAQQEKQALIAAGVDDSESEQERRDRRRAEERMGARHRESKWAKGIKDSGRAKWDDDARGGVTDMARRGEELRLRIEGKPVHDDDNSAVSSDSEEGGDSGEIGNGEQDGGRKLKALKGDDNDLDNAASGSRLASMDFMKNAERARRARNNANLESLRRDITGEETPSEDDAEGPGRKIFGPEKTGSLSSKANLEKAKNEFEEKQDSDVKAAEPPKHEGEDLEIIVHSPIPEAKAKVSGQSSISDKRKADLQMQQEPLDKIPDNPWLAPTKERKRGKNRNQDSDIGPIVLNTLPTEAAPPSGPRQTPRSALKGARKEEREQKSRGNDTESHAAEGSDEDENGDHLEDLPFVLRNQDLIRKAFAGDEVVADFEAEKRAVIEDEEEKTIDNTLPGWGSWTGAGIGKKQQKRNKRKVLTKQPGIAKEKRQDAKLDRVIINEKRVKKNGKYLASSLPHPFETRQQYQRSLRMGVGPEFSTKLAFQDATKPRILMKQGIITPMRKPII